MKVELTLREDEVSEIKEKKQEKKDIKPEEINDAKVAIENFLNSFLKQISNNIEYIVKCEESVLYVNIKGEESVRLIGYRGEALNSLQVLLTTIASKNSDGNIKVILDIGNYKDVRKKTLEELAEKVSKTVLKTGKSITLEPMSAYERKIIHSKLQDNNKIETHSIGEGDNRRVVISKIK